MFALAHSSVFVQQQETPTIQGMVRWRSVIYGVTEKEPKKKKKKHQTNKWTIQTTFIYLRQSLLRKQITFCRLSGEMAFPFPSPALQGQQLGWVWGEAEANEKKGTHRPLLVPSHCPSCTKQAEGTLFFLPFVTRWRWSGATDPWRILSIPLSLT